MKSDRRETLNCGVGKYITVYPDGSVFPCHLLSFPEFCVGNVRNQDLYTIFHESEMLNKLRTLDFKKEGIGMRHPSYREKEISQCHNCFRELSGDDRCLGKACRDKDSKDKLLELLEE
ncbi:MAG: SPASM domain-containing protein [Candidatus Eremiobacteraeota bacterium]|nr:SPASM domain-containing protein [Candidatus Eremiobacteraeota bacterium]